MKNISYLLLETLAILLLLSAQSAGRESSREENSKNFQVALTFDDGPSSVTTPKILEILARHGARATFFLTGSNAERYPGIVRRMDRERHEIGNHTFCHFDLLRCDRRTLEWQISAAQNSIERIIGFRPKIFRPPYSRISETVRSALKTKGLKVIMWNVSPEDYLEISPQDIADRVSSQVKPGDIVVMHDYRWQTVMALDEILNGLKKKGLQAVTVSELKKGEL
jgi:peptidoglycan/xylan/chitin deacetylase (PgdA/CDA1 family)